MTTSHVLTFRDLLRQRRQAAGLTQEELAERARLSPRAIGALERGERSMPRRATVQLLADALVLTEDEYAELLAVARRRSSAAPHPDTAVPGSARGAEAPALVGRDREVALIEQQLTAAGPLFLILAGEPGIGKSRLLHEAAWRARRAGWLALESGCHRQGGQEPYAPLVAALARHLAETPPDQARRDLRGCDWLTRLLPESAGLVGRPPQTWTLPPEQERRLLFAAVARYLKHIAGPSGTLLALDDLHWAGRDALDLLAALADAAGDIPVRVLGAYRDTEIHSDDPLARLVLDLARAGLAQRVELGPLPPADAAQLLDNLLGHAGDRGQLLRDALLRRAAGIPFYLVSCAQGLHSGAMSSARHARIPWDVAETVRQRIGVLPEAGRELLRISAIVGRVAPVGVLTTALTLLHTREDEALAALEAASDARLLLRANDTTYEFAHDLIRDVVLDGLDPARRAALHVLIAEALERQPGEPPVDVLAYHYDHGGLQTRAVVFLQRAAERAWSLHAHAEAEAYYRALVERLDTLAMRPEAARARARLGGILRTIARYDEAVVVLNEAVDSYRAVSDYEGLGTATAQLGWCYAQRGTPHEGIARLRPLRDALAALEISQQALAALDLALAQLYYISGQHDQQLIAATRAVELAREVGAEPTLVQAELRRGNALLMLGRMDEGATVVEGAIPLAEVTGDLWSLAHALNSISVVYETHGEFERTHGYVERAFAVAERMGDPTMLAFMTYRRGMNAFYLGDWAHARACFELSARHDEAVGASWVSAYPPFGLGHISLVQGEYDVGAAYLDAALVLAERRGNMPVLQYAQSIFAEWELLAGNAEAARSRLQPLLDRSEGTSDVAMLLPLLAWAYLLRGDDARAVELAERADYETDAQTNRFDRLDALRVRALLAMSHRDWHAADDLLRQALTLSVAMPFPYAEAKLLYTYGLLHAQADHPEQALQRLTHARTICARLGERLYGERIDDELRRLGRS